MSGENHSADLLAWLAGQRDGNRTRYGTVSPEAIDAVIAGRDTSLDAELALNAAEPPTHLVSWYGRLGFRYQLPLGYSEQAAALMSVEAVETTKKLENVHPARLQPGH